MDLVWAFIKGSRDTIMPFVTFIAGFLVGLVLFGWFLTPVAYRDATPQDLRVVDYQQYYLRSLADQYTDGTIGLSEMQNALNVQGWTTEGAVTALCNAANIATVDQTNEDGGLILPANGNAVNNINTVVTDLIGGNCSSEAAINILQNESANSESGSVGSWIQFCLLGLVLLGLIGTAFYLWQRRSGGDFDGAVDFPRQKSTAMPSNPPAMGYESDSEFSDGSSDESGNVIPIASYRTTYQLGLDAYDDSFSIENVNGEFLGECGVGISESLGSDTPKRVTALEVWLFDKNDIRTITKVAMSDHAFFDEALKAKLAPKGEPILARQDEVIVLETATLIINARITDLIYGDDRQSFFERFAVELSAWAKEDAPSNSMEFDFE